MSRLNKLILEVNRMIRNMFENKIFLLDIVIAIVAILLGMMSNLNHTHLAILILTIASSLRGSINFSLARDEEKKLALGTMLLFNALCAGAIGYILFIQAGSLSFTTLYNKINSSNISIYSLILIIPALISIIAKMITKNGEPLYGGIISGHTAFCVSVYLLSINQNIIFALLLPIPIITILSSRCSEYKCKIIPSLLITGISIGISVYLKANIILILAQLLFVPLLLGTKNGKKVHSKKEIFLGLLTGAITTILILFIFNRINTPF